MQDQQDQLSPTQRAILQLRDMRAQLEAYERRQSEPIAIVGMGCRFPGGVTDPDAFWKLLRDGVDAISEVPRDRFDIDQYYDANPDAPGRMSTRWGGFLSNVDRFDPDFFGISSREAATLDPQQRLLLEVTWEAFERAGYSPNTLFGSPTGVFVGIGSFDYMQLQLQRCAPEQIDAYFATGGCHSVASGRLSYVLGLQGPSVSIDTACSSSLVAVHLACQSLRTRECNLAVAGGVNVILAPELLINFSKAHMMAPDGRCKVFDAGADGFVRAEGCGMVVLQRLSDALAANANIVGVIRGTAMNQDGRSSGLTAPNGPSQRAVIRAALANAGVQPADVHYVEAHGTGTALGDPIEVQALADAYREGRSAGTPLRVGSVKTNIGHAEAAAGLAGLIKLVLSLQHGFIPPHLHLRQPSPHIEWTQFPIVVPTTGEPWARGAGRRIGGVSSFGFSGTNAHVVIEEAPTVDRQPAAIERPLHVVTLSARSESSLRELANRYATHLAAQPELSIADVAFTANVGRTHFAHRTAIIASTSIDAGATLKAIAAGAKNDAVMGRADAVTPEVVFLFTGQGSQYPQMGRRLYETFPVFRAAMDRCDELLRPQMDRSILSVIYPKDRVPTPLDETAYTQPALFALEYALCQVWQSWGVTPAMAIGHSLGEDVAACVAGVFDLGEALALIAARGRLMQDLPKDGEMVAVFADDRLVGDALGRNGSKVSIAALNGPGHVTVSGERDAVRTLVADLEHAGVRTKRLATSHAFHSSLMDPMLEPYERLAAQVRYAEPRFGLVSTLTGDVIATSAITSPTYWRRHVRETVRFAPGIRTLYDRGYRVFVEIGPNSTLTAMGRQSVPEDDALWVNSLRKDRDWEQLVDAVAKLHVRGVNIDWSAFDRDCNRRRVALPTYPFKRTRCWFTTSPAASSQLAPPSPEIFARVESRVRDQANQVPLDLALDTYPAKWAAAERLSLAYMLDALQRLGVLREAGELRSAADVLAACGIEPAHHKLVSRWLDLLAERGILELDANGAYKATGIDAAGLLDRARRDATAALADIPFFLAYVAHCGALLPDVITGRVSPVDTLFPGGSREIAEQIYSRWAMSRYFNGIVRSAVEAFMGTLPGNRRITLLEIGAGTGGTTMAVAPVLPQDRGSYVFSDVSDYFLAAARRQFASWPALRYQLLDIERRPEDQGFTRESFDIVIAANVLHATRRIDETLEHARSLIAPGGLLVLYEVTDPPVWLDVTFGLFEGWQRFDDDIRAGTPTLSRDAWIARLRANGFVRVTPFPEAGSPAEALRAHVIVAQVSGSVGSATSAADITTQTADEEADATPTAAGTLLQQLAEAAVGQRRDLLVDFVRDHVMSVLHRDPENVIDRRERLMDLGIDSLMAVELRDRVSAGLPLTRSLTTTMVFDLPSIDAIAGFLNAHLPGPAVAVAAPETAREAEDIVLSAREAEIRDLSDDEVEAMLLRKLDTL